MVLSGSIWIWLTLLIVQIAISHSRCQDKLKEWWNGNKMKIDAEKVKEKKKAIEHLHTERIITITFLFISTFIFLSLHHLINDFMVLFSTQKLISVEMNSIFFSLRLNIVLFVCSSSVHLTTESKQQQNCETPEKKNYFMRVFCLCLCAYFFFFFFFSCREVKLFAVQFLFTFIVQKKKKKTICFHFIFCVVLLGGRTIEVLTILFSLFIFMSNKCLSFFLFHFVLFCFSPK